MVWRARPPWRGRAQCGAAFRDHTDDRIGRLIAGSDQMEQLDNTISIVMADNGASMDTLVLTHYVPAISGTSGDERRALAAEHFSDTIELGDDLHRVVVNRVRPGGSQSRPRNCDV